MNSSLPVSHHDKVCVDYSGPHIVIRVTNLVPASLDFEKRVPTQLTSPSRSDEHNVAGV